MDKERQSDNAAGPWSALDAGMLKTYEDSSMPNELDVMIEALVQAFASSQPRERDSIRVRLERSHYEALNTYSERAATLAVRERSLNRLRSGITAAAILAGTKYADPRDMGGLVFILLDAGRRIGAPIAAELIAAGQMAGHGRELFEYYGGRGAVSRMFGGVVLRLGIGMERVEGKGTEFRYRRGPMLNPDAVRAREKAHQLQANARKAGKNED